MKRRNEVLVGILLTIAVLIGVVGSIWLARGGLRSGYPLYAVFPWGSGLRQGQPVLLGGVNVGYVDDVELRNDGTVLVKLAIQKKYNVPAGVVASVEAVGIFGDMAVALHGRPRPDGRSLAAGDTVPAGGGSPSVAALLSRADTISASVGDLTKKIDVELVQGGGVADARQTIAEMRALVASLGRVVAEQSRQLSITQTQVRRTLSAVDSATIDSTMKNVRATSAHAAVVSANAAALTDSLKATTSKINATLARLERGEGTAGKLLTDTLLYSDVRRLVQRVDSLTADFKVNPRKYIKLSVF
jgi:phospholipid/cholesterol/gamma-HCH transport system substrate-binding protein